MEDYKKINLDSYNTNAEVFSNHFSGLFDLEERKEFKRFLSLLKGNRVIDLGCGGGDHSLWFKAQGLKVKAIDFSPEMVKLARSKGLDAEVMDIEDLKFNKNSFDGVWAVTSLLHIPKKNMPKVLKKISEILSSDGLFYLCLKEGQEEKFVIDKQNLS